MNGTEAGPDLPRWHARQVVLATLSVVGVVLAFWLAYRFSSVLFILVIGIVLGTAIRPLVSWLSARGLGHGFGLIVAHTLILALVIGVLYLVLPIVIQQALDLAGEVPRYYSELRSALVSSPSRVLRIVSGGLPGDFQVMLQPGVESGEDMDVFSGILGFAGVVLKGLFSLSGVILIASFWVLEGERTTRGLLILFPASRREKIRAVTATLESKVGAYVRGQLLLSFTIGFLALLAYSIIGLPNTLALAVIAGIFEVIPILGPLLGAIPAVLVAFSIQPVLALWVVLATAIIQGLENYLLVPRVMHASVGVNPILTLLVLFTFSSLMGLPGALLAIPAAAAIQLFLSQVVLSPEMPADSIAEGRDYASLLRYEAQDLVLDVRKQLRRKVVPSNESNDRIEESIESIASQLDLILVQLSKEEADR